MEEIFANQGLQHIAEKICYFLPPKSFQSLILTSEFMMHYAADNFNPWFLKCQKAKLFTDFQFNKWKIFVNFAQEMERDWILAIVFKFIHYHRNSELVVDLVLDPFQIVSLLGYIEMVDLIMKTKDYSIFWDKNCSKLDLIPKAVTLSVYFTTPLERVHYFRDCIINFIRIQGIYGITGTFKGYKSVLKWLLETAKSVFESLIGQARLYKTMEIKKILVLILNKQDNFGWSPMHTLASYGNVDENIRAVEFAASLCKEPNPQDDFGTTPMHIAAEFGHLEFVKALIPCWTNMWAENQDSKTALQIAESKGHHEIARLLQTKIKTE